MYIRFEETCPNTLYKDTDFGRTSLNANGLNMTDLQVRQLRINKMAEKGKDKMVEHEVKKVELKITDLNPKQKVLDLNSNEEAEIEVKSQRFEAPTYDEKIHGTPAQFEQNLLHTAMELVSPVSKR